MAFIGKLEGVRDNCIQGWVWNPSLENERLRVKGELDGEVIFNIFADKERGDLISANIGDGCHAFKLHIAKHLLKKTPVEIVIYAESNDDKCVLGKIELPSGLVKESILSTKSPFPQAKKDKQEDKSSFKKKINVKKNIIEAGALEADRKLEESYALLNEALEVEPDNVEILFRFARVLYSLGKKQEAKEVAEKTIIISPKNHKAYITLARIAEEEGQLALSLEYWMHVPEGESAYRERLIKSARIMSKLERLSEATKLLAQAIAIKHDVNTEKMLNNLRDVHDINPIPKNSPLGAWSRSLARPIGPALIINGYRETMTDVTSSPIAVGLGNSIFSLLIGASILPVISKHMDTPIDVIVPEPTLLTELLLSGKSFTRHILTPSKLDNRYEIALLLPEFTLHSETMDIPSKLRFSLLEEIAIFSGDHLTRYNIYTDWLSDKLGMSSSQFADPAIDFELPETTEKKRPTIIARNGHYERQMGFIELQNVLKVDVGDVQLLELGKQLDDSNDAIAALNSSLVITEDMNIAILCASAKIPLIFISVGDEENFVRHLAPQVSTISYSNIRPSGTSSLSEYHERLITEVKDCINKINSPAKSHFTKRKLTSVKPSDLKKKSFFRKTA